MGDLQENCLSLSPEDIGRQAVDSLRGYIYQIYQSLAAWLDLSNDEILFLEVAEDYSVLTQKTLKAVQVKDIKASGSITLKSKSVCKAIQSFWNFQNQNHKITVVFHYLTTATIGKEKSFSFPENQPGLIYWKIAVREHSDIEPIRKALLNIDLSEDLKAFINTASAEELQDRLLSRINWDCGAKEISPLAQSILNRLVNLGERFNLLPTDAEQTLYPLLGKMITVILFDDQRQLKKEDLLRFFEKHSTVPMPLSAVRKSINSVTSSLINDDIGTLSHLSSFITNVSQIPLPRIAIERSSLVDELIKEMGRCGSLWLHGSSGLGKTVLAQFITRRSKHNWYIVRLRGYDPLQSENILRATLRVIDKRNLGGLILDDLSIKNVSHCRFRLSILSNELNRCDASLVVTSTSLPSPTIKDCICTNSVFIQEIPYFTKEDVSELVVLAGGNAERWSGVIHTSCGFGHPQLVAARISGLVFRGWPEGELLSGFTNTRKQAKEVEEERRQIRSRLLYELPENARELLYRLTIITSYFDRELALAIGDLKPKLPRPGELFEYLLGPWIEARSENRFQISPLVSDAGYKILSESSKNTIHLIIVDHLLTRRPFPADFLSQLLIHALISRHESGLRWLAGSVIFSNDANRRIISEQLFVLPLMNTDKEKPLFHENVHVSFMLRLAQFEVAAATQCTGRLNKIADCMISEARTLKPEVILKSNLVIAISKVLMERSLSISPKTWIPMIIELKKLITEDNKLSKIFRSINTKIEGLENWTLEQGLFANRATSLESINDLSDLFDQLNSMESNLRDYFLSALNIPYVITRLLVHTAWVAEHKKGSIDGQIAAEKYDRLSKIAESWKHRDLSIECIIARSVMLDEYNYDYKSALKVLNEADKIYPNEIRLARQRAKIHYRHNDYKAALHVYESFTDMFPSDDSIERAFVLREAGICAAETGKLNNAIQFFYKARESLNQVSSNMLPMAVGLLGDCAFIQFKKGNYNEAIKLTAQALQEVEKIDPEAGKKEKFCRIILGQLIIWMLSKIEEGWRIQKKLNIANGGCSNPDPSDKITELITPSFLLTWYLLALLEVKLGIDVGVLSELKSRTKNGIILSTELNLRLNIIIKSIKSCNVGQFFDNFIDYISIAEYYFKNKDNIQSEDMLKPSIKIISNLCKKDWQRDDIVCQAKNALLSLITNTVIQGRDQLFYAILQKIKKIKYVGPALTPFIEYFDKNYFSEGDVYEVAAVCVRKLRNNEESLDPNEMFLVTYYLWNWLRLSEFRTVIELELAKILAKKWCKILKNQRFLFKQPIYTIPLIEAAIDESNTGIEKMASIILATEDAVDHNLALDLRKIIKNSATKFSKKSPV